MYFIMLHTSIFIFLLLFLSTCLLYNTFSYYNASVFLFCGLRCRYSFLATAESTVLIGYTPAGLTVAPILLSMYTCPIVSNNVLMYGDPPDRIRPHYLQPTPPRSCCFKWNQPLVFITLVWVVGVKLVYRQVLYTVGPTAYIRVELSYCGIIVVIQR